MNKKIIAVFLCFATVFAFSAPCHADEFVSENSLGTIWDNELSGWLQSFVEFWAGEGDVCDKSPDTHHHASSSIRQDSDGNYVCVCSYCGDSFTTSLAQIKEAEAAAVAALPASGYASSSNVVVMGPSEPYTPGGPTKYYCADGSFLWFPTFSDCWPASEFTVPNLVKSYSYLSLSPFPLVPGSSASSDGVNYVVLDDMRTVKATMTGKNYSCLYAGPSPYANVLVAPMAGTYTHVASDSGISTGYSYVLGGPSGTKSFSSPYTGASFHADAGGKLKTGDCQSGSFQFNFSSLQGSFSLPVYVVVPDAVADGPDYTTIYDNSTRVGNYVGSYAVHNSTDNSYNPVSGDTQIVNETDNSVYNPVTNTTTDYSGWTYDYSTRTYTFSNDDNSSTSTVTYGDENITIADTAIDGNGNTVTNNYTVYYYNAPAADTPSPSPSPSPSAGPVGPGSSTPPSCKHDWTYKVDNEPTCLSAGSKTGTCSLCKETKKETIPATGHTWVIKKSLATAYDDEGNLVQQGYTIYKCSICGEEYKDVDGVGPPGSSSEDKDGQSWWSWIGEKLGGLISAAMDLIGGLVGGVIDGLVSLLEMLLGKLGTVVEAILSVFSVLPSLFTGFLDLLSALFPFLPEEVMTILTFGIIACVVIGIIRLIWR